MVTGKDPRCYHFSVYSLSEIFGSHRRGITKFSEMIKDGFHVDRPNIFAPKSHTISLRMILADNTEVDYLLYTDNFDEIWRGEDLGDDFLLEEMEYHDNYMVQCGNQTNPEVTGIHLRQRRQICEQELPCEGTAMKRVRMQKYPVQDSSVKHQQDGYIAYLGNDYIYDLQEQLMLFDNFNG